jgi:SPP1 gp7 family putative phage head morphogenesis protein
MGWTDRFRRQPAAAVELATSKSDVDMGEKAVVRDDVEQLMQEFATYNTEAEGELPIATYRKMMRREPQVKAAVQLKIHARVSSGYEIKPASDSPEDKKIAEFVESQFDQMAGTMDKFLRRTLLAMAYGLTVHEIVYEPLVDGDHKGKVGLKELKWKKPEKFVVETDKYGNIKALKQEQNGKYKRLPHEYFIIHAWDHEGDWVGRSDLRPAYRYYRAKDLNDRFWNLYQEKYASPTPTGKHPPGAGYTEKREMLRFLTGVNTSKAAVFPKNWDVEFLEAMRQGGNYEQRNKYCDRMMARAILLPTLLIDEGESGAYALGQQHSKNFVWVLKSLGEELAQEVVEEQLIRRLVDINFTSKHYPKFVFKPFDPNELLKQTEQFIQLVDKNIVNFDEPFVRERLGLPPEDPDNPLEKPEPPAIGNVGQPSAGSAADGDPMNRPDTRKPDGQSTPATKLRSGEDVVELSALSLAATKFDAQRIGSELTQMEDETTAILAAAVAEWKASLIRQVREKKILANRDYDAVNKLTIPAKSLSAFRKALESMLGNAIHMGSSDATDELKRSGFDVGQFPASMGHNLNAAFEEDEGFVFSQSDVTDFWKSKTAIQRALLQEYTREAFTISGVFRDDILEGAQRIISRGIRRGATGAMIEEDLAAFFRPYVAEGVVAGAVTDPFRLETLVRTNLSEAYNTGRMNLFRHPDVGNYIVAYEYSAILDRNTTPFCRSWHGAILRADDPRVMEFNPPNHFRCRSVWIPITQYESYKVTEETSELNPQSGFLGCAWRNHG